jgi:opacity protein-like surface antigen
MRLAALPLLLALTAPVAAADAIADQAARAYELFAAGQAQTDFLSARYAASALSGVAGDWVSLNGPAPGTGVTTYGADTERFCKGAGVLRLATPDTLSLRLTANPVGTAFSQTYTLIAGASFAQATDPAAYFAAIGLGPDKRGEQFDRQRAAALSLANGIVQIYRPSADILVITRDGGYPNVLARCPRS